VRLAPRFIRYCYKGEIFSDTSQWFVNYETYPVLRTLKTMTRMKTKTKGTQEMTMKIMMKSMPLVSHLYMIIALILIVFAVKVMAATHVLFWFNAIVANLGSLSAVIVLVIRKSKREMLRLDLPQVRPLID
jgi:hypothetical protein